MKKLKNHLPYLTLFIVTLITFFYNFILEKYNYSSFIFIIILFLFYYFYDLYKKNLDKNEYKVLLKKINALEKNVNNDEKIFSFLNFLPFNVFILNEKGIIKFANSSSFDIFKNIEIEKHISSIFRSPYLLNAIDKTIVNKIDNKLEFEIPPPEYKYLEAEIFYLDNLTIEEFNKNILLCILDKSDSFHLEQMRNDFITSASHELKTPLSSIIGSVETLKTHKGDQESITLFLNIIEKQSRRMKNIVDDLLSLSRLEKDDFLVKFLDINLFKVISDTIFDLNNLSIKYDVKIKNKISNKFLNISGDNFLISQAINNLIENAIIYSGKGSLIEINSEINKENNTLGVIIKDNGIGISSNHIHRLTEKFYRVDDIKSKDRQATGLGLSIVKNIMEKHNGFLKISSTLGSGSSFSIWFPYVNS